MSNESREIPGGETEPELPSNQSKFRRLRIWPPLLLLAGMVVARWIPTLVIDGPPKIWMSSAFGPALCGILILLWWLLLSRARWQERILGIAGIFASAAAAIFLCDASMIGPATVALTIPMGMAAFAIGAILVARWLSFKRTLVAVLLGFCGFGFSSLLRSDGLWGDFSMGLHWRWKDSAEEKLLAEKENPLSPPTAIADLESKTIDAGLADPEWPAFRGPDRIGRQRGTSIKSDWSQDPPEIIWKIAVGPGWSSFSVAGPLLFTQEQRGAMETVVCYDATSGREIWTHDVKSRFDDPLGGPGPRATPTVSNGMLFVLGASGQLMRLDPKTGSIVWEKDLREAADRSPPEWGFCSSPLVVDSVVIVYGGGAGDKGTLAFDVESGDLRWTAAAGDHSYSSPQLSTVAGQPLVLVLTNTGLNGLEPATGIERLNYDWECEGYRALQPQVIDGDRILIPTGMGYGTRCIRVSEESGELVAEEQWTSRKLKPDFNDFIVFQGQAYGFDGSLLTCIDLETGDRQWKRGRYGLGQLLLLEDCGLLLVASEYGDIVVVRADPAKHVELAKFKAIEGKTWNHPVVVGDRLFIRNSQEAACLRLPLAAESPTESTTPAEAAAVSEASQSLQQAS